MLAVHCVDCFGIARFSFYANSSSRQKYHHGSFLTVRVIQYILVYIQDLTPSLQMILVGCASTHPQISLSTHSTRPLSLRLPLWIFCIQLQSLLLPADIKSTLTRMASSKTLNMGEKAGFDFDNVASLYGHLFKLSSVIGALDEEESR